MCPQPLEKLQVEYIILIYRKQTKVAFICSHVIWCPIFYEIMLNVFRAMFVAFFQRSKHLS